MAEARGAARGEMAHQRWHVFGTLPQRRDVNRQHVEPEPEVFAELPLAHRRGEILVGRGDHAHVDREGPLPAHPMDDARLEHAQQFRLRFRAQVADFIQEQRAAVGQLEAALAPLGGAGEGAALVAEHFRLDEIARQRRAVDGDERLARAGALAVDRRGHQLLARARFSCNQHP